MTAYTRSVGIVLGAHLGDVILYSSVLKPLRDHFSDAEIILIASPPAEDLFGDSPYIDRVVGVRQLYPDLEPWALNLVVDALVYPCHFVSPFEYDLLSVIGQREVIGRIGGPCIDRTGKRHSRNPFWENNVTYSIPLPRNHQSTHVFHHIAEFLRELGCATPGASDLRVEIDIRENDFLSAWSLIASFGSQPYGMLFPGASYFRDLKMWPLDRYAEVIRLLGSRGPRCWVVCGAEAERQECHDVVQLLRRTCPDIQAAISCGQPLRHVAALLKGARLAIGSDNGGMHMAVAVGTPALSIVSGAGDELYFPWGNPDIHRAVKYPMECIEGITPKAVADECLDILKPGRGGAERS